MLKNDQESTNLLEIVAYLRQIQTLLGPISSKLIEISKTRWPDLVLEEAIYQELNIIYPCSLGFTIELKYILNRKISYPFFSSKYPS